MLTQRDIAKVLDIKECINRIESYTQKYNYTMFMNDIKTQDAVVRNLEIIGEAVKSLSDNFKNKHSDISWSEIGRMRDKLIHHYSGINYDIVWSIVKTEIPRLKKYIAKI